MQALCDMGYSASDIITTLFRVVKSSPGMNEYLKLEYIKVRAPPSTACPAGHAPSVLSHGWSSARWERT